MEQDWFPSLYGEAGLFNKYPKEEILPPRVLIQYQLPTKRRFYRLFENEEDLCDYLDKIPKEKQHFYEVIPGEWKQKPHFDIDLSDPDFKKKVKELETKYFKGEKKTKKMREAFDAEYEELLETTSSHLNTLATQIIEEITQQLLLIGISPEELRWYSSNSQTKKSFHLIIPKYFFENNIQAKRLWQFFQERLPADYSKYIDDMVYSKLQNFRVLGSHKPPKNDEEPRPKKLRRKWDFSGEEIIINKRSKRQEIIESLIGHVEEDAEPFPDFEIEGKNMKKGFIPVSEEFPEGLLEEVENLAQKALGPNFTLAKVNGSVLSYRREAPSHCEICNRIHDSIWPFVNIFSFGQQWRVYLFCARAKIYQKNPKKEKSS